MKITTILIDDEPKALSILENKLGRFCPELNIIGTTQSPENGLKMIHTLKPNLVFLDVAMPCMSGFELLSQIESPSFEVIFATAFDQFAINAIRHCAIGYLTKPIDNEELKRAVKNAVKNISMKTASKKNEALIENFHAEREMHKLAIPYRDGLEFITISSIIRCEGYAGYTEIYLTNETKILSSYSIGHFRKLLQHEGFYSVHKSHLINTLHIMKYLNEGAIEMTLKHHVPVARNNRTDFLHFLKNGL